MAVTVPSYTYTGMHTSQVIGNCWYIFLWSPGTFTFGETRTLDVCLVGGGAGGQEEPIYGGIGGHGGQVYSEAVSIQAGSGYAVDIGVGGQIGENGGTTTGFGLRAWGGGAGMGGASGGAYEGGKGTDGVYPFDDSNLDKYGACGGGGGYPGGNGGEKGGGNGATHEGASATAGTAGMGAGGGGGAYNAAAAIGGAGCVILRGTEDDTLPVKFNGQSLTKITFNGQEVTGLIYNGQRIFMRALRRARAWLFGRAAYA